MGFDNRKIENGFSQLYGVDVYIIYVMMVTKNFSKNVSALEWYNLYLVSCLLLLTITFVSVLVFLRYQRQVFIGTFYGYYKDIFRKKTFY